MCARHLAGMQGSVMVNASALRDAISAGERQAKGLQVCGRYTGGWDPVLRGT